MHPNLATAAPDRLNLLIEGNLERAPVCLKADVPPY